METHSSSRAALTTQRESSGQTCLGSTVEGHSPWKFTVENNIQVAYKLCNKKKKKFDYLSPYVPQIHLIRG